MNMNVKFLILISSLIGLVTYSQTNVITNNKLIIPHGNLTLYLDDDTSTLVSKQVITYKNFKNISKFDRCNCWFQDTYKGKYLENKFTKTGFDKGHLTPSSITSYDSTLNRNSFSMFNEAPQYSYFNQHQWKDLELSVQDTIAKYKRDAVIITGVIYNEDKKRYLPNSRIKIPTHYYKVVVIGNITYIWLGINVDGKKYCKITKINLFDLNKLFISNKINLIIK